MSNYASTALSGNMLDVAQLVSELTNDLPARRVYDTFTGGMSYASASYSTITGLTETLDVEADEVILLFSMVSVSCGTVGEKVAVQHFNDSSAAGIKAFWREPVGSTDGESVCLPVLTRYQGLSGSVEFSTRWARASGSGTIYCREGSQTIIVLKQRA